MKDKQNIATKTKVSLILLLFIVLVLLFGFIIYNSRSYLPELPVDGISKKQAYEKISNTHNGIIFLINENNSNWYIYQGNKEDFRSELIKRFNTLGFNYIEQMGSGYIFELKGNEDKLIVQSQMWTGEYIIFKMPEKVDVLSIKVG